MPKLSIILPVLGRVEALEQTLVSVLENRPDACEVLLVLNGPYDDPYCLEGEVRFITAPATAGWVESVNLGLQQALSPIVHLLDCGLTVPEGWMSAAMRHFEDPRIAAVAPLVVSGDGHERVSSAGVEYRVTGRRIVAGQGDALPNNPTPRPVLGPCRAAGLYRKASLDLLGGFEASVGDELADVDVALRLRHAGFRAVFDPRSCITDHAPPVPRPSVFSRARASERLFWRAAPVAGLSTALVAHLGSVAVELLLGLPTGKAVLQGLGRLLACSEMSNFRRHHATLEQQRLQAAVIQARHMDLIASDEHRGGRRAEIDYAMGEIPRPHLSLGSAIREDSGEPVGKRRPR